MSISLLPSQGLPELSFRLAPDRLSSDPLQKPSCLYPEHISGYFLLDGQYSVDILFWGGSRDGFFDPGQTVGTKDQDVFYTPVF